MNNSDEKSERMREEATKLQTKFYQYDFPLNKPDVWFVFSHNGVEQFDDVVSAKKRALKLAKDKCILYGRQNDFPILIPPTNVPISYDTADWIVRGYSKDGGCYTSILVVNVKEEEKEYSVITCEELENMSSIEYEEFLQSEGIELERYGCIEEIVYALDHKQYMGHLPDIWPPGEPMQCLHCIMAEMPWEFDTCNLSITLETIVELNKIALKNGKNGVIVNVDVDSFRCAHGEEDCDACRLRSHEGLGNLVKKLYDTAYSLGAMLPRDEHVDDSELEEQIDTAVLKRRTNVS